jgi:hypothetical protein
VPTCVYHPQVEETVPCAGCGRPFCENCLAEIMGQRLCADCKSRMVQGVQEAGHRRQQHPLALSSVLVPVLGYIFTCALLVPLTSLIGLYLGSRVLRETGQQEGYSGRSIALAGMVISGGTLFTWVVAVIALVLFSRFT